MSITAITDGATSVAAKGTPISNDNVEDEFETAFQRLMDFLQQNPIERMQHKWLESHGLTEESLNALPAEKQDAIRDAMADYIRQQLTGSAGHGTSSLAVF